MDSTNNNDVVAGAARCISRALMARIPKLTLGNDEFPIVLTLRRANEYIDDSDCQDLFQCLTYGVYRSYPMTRGDGTSDFRWMYLCPGDEDSIALFLGDEISRLGHADRETISMDAVWQLIQWEDVQKRKAKRERQTQVRNSRS